MKITHRNLWKNEYKLNCKYKLPTKSQKNNVWTMFSQKIRLTFVTKLTSLIAWIKICLGREGVKEVPKNDRK